MTTTTTDSNKKGQRLTMLQFYKLIIAKWAPKLVAFNRSISDVTIPAKDLQQMIKKRERLFHKDETEAAAAVNAVSDEITFAISNRMKGFQINFESQLLLMYFTKLIFVLGLGDGFDASRVTATNVLSDLFEQLDEVISKQHGEVAWKDVPIGQLGFLRSKHQRYKIAINALFLALDFRLQKAMAKIYPETRAKDRAKLPEKALKIMQDYAKHDAKVILKTLGKKKNRTIKVEAILQYIIKPLAKNIFIPSENVPQYKKIPEMSLAQLIILRTHLTQTKSALDNLGRAIHSPNRSRTKSLRTRMKFPASHNKMTTLNLTYDPKTQRGMVLVLRARLGQHFQLRFKPIGANGDEEEEEEEEEEESFPILSLPAELVFYITSFMVKMNPTKAELKGLLSFATSTPDIRLFLEDPFLERMVSQKFLGTVHSRTPAERRLGLEPNVAERYRGVLQLLGSTTNVSALQDMADRNAKIYTEQGLAAYSGFIVLERPEASKEGEERPRKKIKKKRYISSWPWWYFRLLSNHKSLISMKHPFSLNSDPFSASVISVTVRRPVMKQRRPAKEFKLFSFSDANPNSSVYGPEGDLLLLPLGRHRIENAGDWQIWTSGADLMVIPMDSLIQRAGLLGGAAGRKMEIEGPIRLTISVSEPNIFLDTPRKGKASYRKEVAITGLKKMSETMEGRGRSEGKIKKYDINLFLQIQHAYLGKQWNQFLGHKEGVRSFLHLWNLKMGHVHFEDLTPLDLSGITGDQLGGLHFGPTNSSHVPKLFCPASSLGHLALETLSTRDSILLWDLPEKDPTTCFPQLVSLYINGNVKIWESPLLESFSKFPNLRIITINGFLGNNEDLLRLGLVLEQAPQSKIIGGIIVMVQFSAYSYIEGLEIFNRVFKGVRFYPKPL